MRTIIFFAFLAVSVFGQTDVTNTETEGTTGSGDVQTTNTETGTSGSGESTGGVTNTGETGATGGDGETTTVECIEAPSCTAARCALYPAAAQFCPCSCPPVTPECRESDLCDSNTCSAHPNQAHWFCPCTCENGSGSSGTTGTGGSTGTTSGPSFFGPVVPSTSGTSFFGPVVPSTSGTSFFGPVVPSTSGSTGSSGTANPNPLRLSCEMLPRGQCYGHVTGSRGVCMWHSRDYRCREGLPNSAEDVCAQFDTAQDCSARQAVNKCCWDAEGYCDKYDAEDCRIETPYDIVPEIAGGPGGVYEHQYEGHPAHLQNTHESETESSSGPQVGWMVGLSGVGCLLGFGLTMRCTKSHQSDISSEPLARNV